jgi:UDP-N-acetylglucosamine--N-acetylmuramyl-(pentapeptide) pyrophosphoryl-undecaprenol N-acetylglucosamine transferase
LPIRRPIVEVGRRSGAESLCLDPSVTTLLVLGGSLGSKGINEALLGALKQLHRDREPLGNVQVLHVTGHQHCPAATRLPFANYRSVPYLDRSYPEALAAADLVVSRAGASTVAEIAARGLPAVLIPWSGASCDEQVRNAEDLVRAGAAVMILDRELTPERLAAVLFGLLRDAPRRAQMAEASRRLGRPKAAEEVASIALGLAERRRAVSPLQDSRGGRSV